MSERVNNREPGSKRLEQFTFVVTGEDGKPTKPLHEANDHELRLLETMGSAQTEVAQEALNKALAAVQHVARFQGAVRFEIERRKDGGLVLATAGMPPPR